MSTMDNALTPDLLRSLKKGNMIEGGNLFQGMIPNAEMALVLLRKVSTKMQDRFVFSVAYLGIDLGEVDIRLNTATNEITVGVLKDGS